MVRLHRYAPLATGRHVGFYAPFLSHTALRNQIIQNGTRIRETGYGKSETKKQAKVRLY